MWRTPALAVFVALIASVPLRADDGAQPVAAIRAAAESAVAAGPGATVSASVDERLRLPRCSEPLVALPQSAGTVEVACPAAAGWKLYVPVRISRSGAVLVLTRPVGAGMPIPTDALALETRDLARLAGGALADPSLAAGRLARRALPAGHALSAADIALPPVVRRGQSVTLVARAGGLEVRSSGRALADAAPGDPVSVENPSSRRVVTGIAQAGGEVWVR
ncbi:MAG: flagellar basal body P-ring formation protein FlgA [Xanthomonadaceae bacterium]|jgi:flagella basal body P-ring formation protein FlgA|nr:flagellar basal body P-ring formation protein FlgA [Xanthomonadaceae bacterium]